MDYNDIARLHKSDPALLALRKEWLPLAVSFLYYAFKSKHQVLLPQEVFREQLSTYLDYVNAMLPDDAQCRYPADHFLARWSREDDLIRIRSRDEGYIVQLSPHAERLLGWFEDMLSRGMIGTESRLRNILSLLDELVTQSTEDIEQRLQQLYDRREQLDTEIARIEATQQVDGLNNVQIRERLDHISGMASHLLRDFSLVEERFREMARTIQQAQLDPDARRGDILGSALDADEQLGASDEGQSFRAFYELLTHPQQREQFDHLVGAVFDMPRLNTFIDENAVLKRLTSYLLEAGERVNQSNQRLAEHLRRVVDTRNIIESRRVQTLAREIKHLTSQLDEAMIPLMRTRRSFFDLEGEPDVDLPLERPLFEPPEYLGATARPHLAPLVIDTDALSSLYETFFIDDTILRDNIARLLMSRPEVTLAEVSQSYPVTLGVAEIVAYLQIAARGPQHTIDHSMRDVLLIKTPNNQEKSVEIPRIVFRRTFPKGEMNHVR
jgi:hypothetical protein